MDGGVGAFLQRADERRSGGPDRAERLAVPVRSSLRDEGPGTKPARRWRPAVQWVSRRFARAVVAAVVIAMPVAPLVAEGEDAVSSSSRDSVAPQGERAPRPGDVTVAEIVPALRGAPAGRLVLAPAPPLGGSRTVRRRDVLRVLRAAGFPTRGLAIPARVRVRRRARWLQADALRRRILPEVARSVAPCEVVRLQVPRRAQVPAGEPSLRLEGFSRPRPGSRRSVGVVHWQSTQGTVRLSATAQLRCPPPAVSPGQRIRLRVRIGAVTASTPGVARQAGLVGDEVAVHNPASGKRLRGRVVAPGLVEVLR